MCVFIISSALTLAGFKDRSTPRNGSPVENLKNLKQD